MAMFRTNRAFDIVFVVMIGALVWFMAANRTTISDKIFFLRYEPDPKTVQIAASASLTSTGRHLLYRSDPTFGDLATVTAQCDIERLGCLSPKGQTFILDDPTKPNQTLVTATHEMLHLAYRRLSQSKKDELAPLLNQAIAQNAIAGIAGQLEDETTPEDRLDEAHSLLGTEYKSLPAELETYYTTYFSNRSLILTAAASDR